MIGSRNRHVPIGLKNSINKKEDDSSPTVSLEAIIITSSIEAH